VKANETPFYVALHEKPEFSAREIEETQRRRLSVRAPDGSLGTCGMVGGGKRRPYLGSRASPAGTATIPDNLTTPRSVDSTRNDNRVADIRLENMGNIVKVGWVG
jgi:hypothetical protein